jgi:hypothetical protein
VSSRKKNIKNNSPSLCPFSFYFSIFFVCILLRLILLIQNLIFQALSDEFVKKRQMRQIQLLQEAEVSQVIITDANVYKSASTLSKAERSALFLKYVKLEKECDLIEIKSPESALAQAKSKLENLLK